MTRQPHDKFAKQYLSELLAPLGHVETSREVTDEVRQVDVYFSPAAQPSSNPQLGLLGRITANRCLLEAYRNQPSKIEIRNIIKLFILHGEFHRQTRRQGRRWLQDSDLPLLWVLATSASQALLDSLGARLDMDNWPNGVYFLPETLKTVVVAINQLPIVPETMLLSNLGKRKNSAASD